MTPIIPSHASARISIPMVLKAEADKPNAIDASEDMALPLGIILTGGLKLRGDGLTGKGVRVGVIDSGVDAEHSGFDGRVTKQMWFRYGSPLSEDDHGTHVAGTIHMMAPDAEIYDYRVFGNQGLDVDKAIAISIFEACFDGCDIINMSLGGRWPNAEIRTAVQYAHSKGVIVVCAAGNEGDDNPLTNERSYPALWDECLCVAAVGKKENLPVAYFSNSNPQVDYAGIGVNANSFKPDGGFQKMSGTSMACPHVCGLVTALLDKGDTDQPRSAECPNPCGMFSSMFGSDDREKTVIKDDADLRVLLNEKYLIDIGIQGPDVSTGLGFLTYLTKREFDATWRENN